MVVLAVDVGTTSIKAGLFDENLEVERINSVKADVEYSNKNWAEINSEKLWDSVIEACKALVEFKEPDALIFGAHMAGVVPVDEEGNALRKIITWLDERAAGLPEDMWKGFLKIQGYNVFKLWKFIRITGGAPSKTGKDPISKILWLRENEPDIFNKTIKILDVRGYLVARATGNFVTSPDEANLTWLADTRNGQAEWCERILKDYGIPKNLLPEIRNCTEIAGEVNEAARRELGIEGNVKVLVGSGDVAAAAVGSGAVKENEIHIYIGTSDWVAAHVSRRKTDVFHYIGSLLSAIPKKYLLIAEQEVAAGALEWAMKLFDIENQYDFVKEAVCDLKPSRVIFLPWLYGERAPVDDPHVRGGLINFSFDCGKAELLNAVMEGVAMNIKWVYGYVEKMTSFQREVSLVGGGALFDKWCEILASSIRRKVKRLKNPEQTGLRGLATMAYVGLGRESFESAAAKFKVDRIFEVDERCAEIYERKFKCYREIYERLKKIYRELNSPENYFVYDLP